MLGFKTFVEEADTDAAKRSALLENLALISESVCEDPSIGVSLTHFSDCIIISADRTPRALWEMFGLIVVLTSNLLQYDFFVRGGLSVGGTHPRRQVRVTRDMPARRIVDFVCNRLNIHSGTAPTIIKRRIVGG